ncbi:hypothetical protein AMS68_004736 [Peltaster fructicola]|uniref:Rho-GAP domain-containing protein n=1 Tax=Peltaster fructicola TaxID=286661 RepID=A0A6H0XX71_9PEZI|nr:hypothetical protein AMS68_004736 [Peltaster fructicola]
MATFPNGADSTSPTANGAVMAPTTTTAGPPKHVEDVMYSDIGISTLLNRLKQSIASARDFAAFLKKRSALEEEQATGLKRLARSHLETVRRPEVRSGSYAQQLSDVLRIHETMSDNGMQFALSLHQMHEDLNELSNGIERGRKQWKHDGLDAEKRYTDAEQLMQKAKSRYDSFAESYDRARTGDSKGSRRIGLKGPKSAEQHEQDLLQKVNAADVDYEDKVRQAKAQREHLVNTTRPAAVRALRELIQECDTGLTLQLQKYATFNEKLLLGNGLAVSPLTDKDTAGAQKSLRDIIADVNNDEDYNNYVGSHFTKIPRPEEIKYEKHPTLASKQQQPSAAYSAPLTLNTASQPSSLNNRQPQTAGAAAGASVWSPTPASGATQSPAPGNNGQTPYTQQPAYNTQQTPSSYAQPPYPVHPTERAAEPYKGPQSTPIQPYAGAQSIPQTTAPATTAPPSVPAKPSRPVFGLSLEDLFRRDESPVPIIVYQCMQAVELFGLDVEGIYRMSGTSRLVTELREAFNNNPPNSANVDFRNPANFYHDVNSVATLLKQFFRDLPDPLFPKHAYTQFIDAARVDDEYARRDALHQLINDLPDPNYATLRALVLHLHRVIQHENRNRMGASNLAICFAPSLMGAHTGPQIADAGLQARVLDNILSNATAIFDED